MPLTVSYSEGDGVHDTQIMAAIELPDSGTSVIVTGLVQQPGNAAVAVIGSPLTMPAAPGSGSIFWNIQVDYTTGSATVQQSTVSDPSALANNTVIFRQTLVPGNTNPALVPTVTPDPPVGSP